MASIRRLGAATGMRGAEETLWKIQLALEAAGIEFIPAERGKGPGVRLRSVQIEPHKPKAKRRAAQRRL